MHNRLHSSWNIFSLPKAHIFKYSARGQCFDQIEKCSRWILNIMTLKLPCFEELIWRTFQETKPLKNIQLDDDQPIVKLSHFCHYDLNCEVEIHDSQ